MGGDDYEWAGVACDAGSMTGVVWRASVLGLGDRALFMAYGVVSGGIAMVLQLVIVGGHMVRGTSIAPAVESTQPTIIGSVNVGCGMECTGKVARRRFRIGPV